MLASLARDTWGVLQGFKTCAAWLLWPYKNDNGLLLKKDLSSDFAFAMCQHCGLKSRENRISTIN